MIKVQFETGKLIIMHEKVLALTRSQNLTDYDVYFHFINRMYKAE